MHLGTAKKVIDTISRYFYLYIRYVPTPVIIIIITISN